MKRVFFIDGSAPRYQAARYKLTLLLVAACCGAMLSGCAMRKTSTVSYIKFEAPPIEVLPIAADVAVTAQKGTGEATGRTTDIERLRREALAKALNQDPPSADGADLLVGMDVFEERRGTEVKVTVTGYHAFYTNFRTAPPDTLNNDQRDSLRREEFSEIFEIARTLKDLAEEDSAQVEVVKNGKKSAAVQITYQAKHLPTKTETVRHSDGSVSNVVQPVYHTILTDGVFDVNMSGKRIKRSTGKMKATDLGTSNKNNANNSGGAKSDGNEKKGLVAVLAICGGLLLLIILMPK